jgi:hypothetical protein
MADDTLSGFTTNVMLGGLLLTCLLGFAITFMYNNNPTGLNDGTDTVLNASYASQGASLETISSESNDMLEVVKDTNPETSQLGSRDIVATGMSASNQAFSKWNQAKQLITWVFTGDAGSMLLVCLGGLFALTIYFLVTKHIRLGT